MTSLAAKNAFALLNDDAEDAGIDSVNTAKLNQPVQAAPAKSAAPKTTAPAPGDKSNANKKTGPAGPAGRDAGRKPDSRGPNRDRRGPSSAVAGGAAGGEGDASGDGKEARSARHTDKRDRGDGRGYKGGPDGRNERKSHTGRGKEVKKSGAGGKFTMGSEKTDAQEGEKAANAAFQKGVDGEQVIAEVERAEGANEAVENDAAAANVEGGADGANASAEGAAPAADAPPSQMTLEQYLEQKKNQKLEIEGFSKKTVRKVDAESLKMKKLEKEDTDFLFKEGTLGDKAANANADKEGKKKTPQTDAELTKQLFRSGPPAERRERRGGDRGDRRENGGPKSDKGDKSDKGGKRGGDRPARGPKSAAPNVSDTSAFPTLG
mmetsp:Transcript_19312/g.33293  ORF Transcript_19312/g.33293 Transcript_19312/m.33293 type:complete len:378 (+) Transcript_19312:437-1570(+)|eukprot:CAMPEP_0184698700 /NCGR_PEP_ID=MMETSP0313-20130426/5217_1 /TAXON_ID=2792 /ORGANISM="Porphyridium aerugineum, Strain SAG 1380-2" /LENGTH=377 /DNA_ID=CAMNT_0027157671 /DNA_START=394 /DNA_END=1527 /DNA_ORIENTATION=+